MEFGRVASNKLKSIKLDLPKDAPATKRILAQKRRKKKLKVYVGCAKWGRKDWVGTLYPKGTKEKDFFKYYAQQFNSIEFNAAFYRLPDANQIVEWKKNSPKDFLFCPKFSDQITHLRRLKNVEKETLNFVETMSGLGSKLGPIFLMPHPQMGLKRMDTILEFLKSLPKDLKIFLELRHPEWFEEDNLEQIYEVCESLGVGAVITDTAGRRDCVHMRLSTPSVFIRFVGNGLHASDYTRIDAWVKRIKKWIKDGIEEIYFFMHQHDEIYSPILAKYLIEELNSKCKLSLKVPELHSAKINLKNKKVIKPPQRIIRRGAS